MPDYYYQPYPPRAAVLAEAWLFFATSGSGDTVEMELCLSAGVSESTSAGQLAGCVLCSKQLKAQVLCIRQVADERQAKLRV